MIQGNNYPPDANMAIMNQLLELRLDRIENNFQTQINILSDRMTHIEGKVDPKFNPDKTLVIYGLVPMHGENKEILFSQVSRLISVLGPHVNATLTDVLRVSSRDPTKPGLVKAELQSEQQKISVLRAKTSLQRYPEYQRVWIRSSHNNTDRIMFSNFKQLLEKIPECKDLVVTSNGRIVSKTSDPSTQRGNTANKRRRMFSAQSQQNQPQQIPPTRPENTVIENPNGGYAPQTDLHYPPPQQTTDLTLQYNTNMANDNRQTNDETQPEADPVTYTTLTMVPQTPGFNTSNGLLRPAVFQSPNNTQILYNTQDSRNIDAQLIMNSNNTATQASQGNTD